VIEIRDRVAIEHDPWLRPIETRVDAHRYAVVRDQTMDARQGGEPRACLGSGAWSGASTIFRSRSSDARNPTLSVEPPPDRSRFPLLPPGSALAELGLVRLRMRLSTVAFLLAVSGGLLGCYRVGYESLIPVKRAALPEGHVQLYEKGAEPGRPSTHVGVLWMSPPGPHDFTIRRLRENGAARGCDALVDVEYVSERRSNYARAVCVVWANSMGK